MGETPVAPEGTMICCYRCDTPVASLRQPVAYGAVLRADAVVLESGEEPYEGMSILCPRGCTSGFYALVNGERWRVI